jgi:hypothetical protein
MTANTGERADRDSVRDYPEGPGEIPGDTWALRLVASRHHAGRLSIEKAANACGLNPANWVRWEAGAKPRDPDRVEVSQAIADGLGMNFHWLLYGGPLLPARGRPVKRSARSRYPYVGRPVRVPLGQPNGGGRRIPATSPAQPIRTRRVIDRSQPVAA